MLRSSSSRWSAAAVVAACVLATSLHPRPSELLASPAADPAEWWAYRTLRRPSPPVVTDAAFVRSPMDRFVLARLEKRGLAPAPPADRITLLRRATHDLTGLPPTPEEVSAFLADERPDAYERLVDRLLASEQYGVRWGRHWLDLVRYAETDSFERDRRKPAAWRYRDWVIDAFNTDKPYDRFLLEQLAGDEIEQPTFETIVATGYYHLGIRDDEPTDPMQAVYDDLDGVVDTTARVVLGIAMGCARCHDHKKDPIPQRDYYRMLAFFEGLKPYKVGGGNSIKTDHFVKSIPVNKPGKYEHELESVLRRRADLVAESAALAKEAWSRLDEAERASIGAERSQGLVTHLTFDDPAAPGCEVEGAKPEPNGRLDGALRFDGKDDHGRLPRPVQDDFTIALWFRADRPGRGDARDPRWFLGSGLVDGEVPGIVDDFGVSLVADRVAAGTGRPERFLSSGGGFADGKWHHVAFTRDRAAGRITLYVDGWRVDQNGKASKRALTTNKSLSIGRMLPGHGTLAGALDDVRIYDRVLDARGVLDLYLNGTLERATGLAVEARVGRPEAERYQSAVAKLTALRMPRREMADVLCAQERTKIPASHVRRRGNVHQKGEEVQPGFPEVAGGATPEIKPTPGSSTSGRRRTFAEWVIAPDNPLTARVIANRLWQFHFGRGLCRTPNDFGRLGMAPTHPDLLDWLATELIARDWSLKAMHRLMMTSAVYRMSSRREARAAEVDPSNDLFWRFDPRRMDAEEVRDSILAVNGSLNPELGGPSVYPPMPEEVLATSSRPKQAWGKSPPEQANRRSVYIHVKRSLLMPLLVSFDLADTDNSCAVRFKTTQPTQALTMLNSDFMQEQARIFAARLEREAGSVRERVVRGLRLVTCRAPSDRDVADGVEFIGAMQREDGLGAEDALQRYCLILFNLNAFVYVD